MEVMKRFEGLDLVDKVPEELWVEVHNTAQEAGTKTIPKKKRCKKPTHCDYKAAPTCHNLRRAHSNEEAAQP